MRVPSARPVLIGAYGSLPVAAACRTFTNLIPPFIFDGTQWNGFRDGTNWLSGVADISASEAWAVGLVGVFSSSIGQAIERWDGTAWAAHPGPLLGFPYAASADAANDLSGW